MLLGKQIRLNRLLSHSNGKYLGITVDHAMARGVLPGLEDISNLVKKIVEGRPDAITMHKGIAQYCFKDSAAKVPLVVKCTTFSPVHPKEDVVVCSVHEAVKLGADGVSVGAILLGDTQQSQIRQLAQISSDASDLGMPLLAHIYPRGLSNKEEWLDPKNIKYAVRLGAELGVDIVKTMYTGDVDSFATVVASTPAKVAVAGGDAGLHSVEECLALAKNVILAGGIGITFGRCIFQYKHPEMLIKTLDKVIHEDFSVKEGMEYLRDLENSI